MTDVVINKNRRAERAAVNAVRSLLEDQDQIVQEIDGGNDHGEDLYVTFTEQGHRTGDTIAVQVKGGRSFKAKGGFRVPVGDHAQFWLKSNLTVVCVVQDTDTRNLYWANATQQLRERTRGGSGPKSILVREGDRLDAESLTHFIRILKNYIAETAELHRFLTKISGHAFDVTDYLSYFTNEEGEQLIFQQCRGEAHAWLLHSDMDWCPEPISFDALHFGRPDLEEKHGPHGGLFSSLVTVGNVILDHAEGFWLAGCFMASRWYRQLPPIRSGRGEVSASDAD
ncbi:DUF4365 domain-containing protein [Micromonospora azadirachtae]|uniref:DUF4365 domain-containing protein n=1 Tax=Micromonospora azadirachtae TaxID=1970735 RepID=A0ABW2ZXS6_9ACTN